MKMPSFDTGTYATGLGDAFFTRSTGFVTVSGKFHDNRLKPFRITDEAWFELAEFGGEETSLWLSVSSKVLDLQKVVNITDKMTASALSVLFGDMDPDTEFGINKAGAMVSISLPADDFPTGLATITANHVYPIIEDAWNLEGGNR